MKQQRQSKEEGFVSLMEIPCTNDTVAVASMNNDCDLGSCYDCHQCDCDDCVCHDPCDGGDDS